MSHADSSILPPASGTYALGFLLPDARTIQAGRLGAVTLTADQYVYLGSARGPGGLRARVERHLRGYEHPARPAHWHIDALTALVPVAWVWAVESPERLECSWAAVLHHKAGAAYAVRGFGASDCTCPAHLLLLPDGAQAEDVRAVLAAVSPGRLLLYSNPHIT